MAPMAGLLAQQAVKCDKCRPSPIQLRLQTARPGIPARTIASRLDFALIPQCLASNGLPAMAVRAETSTLEQQRISGLLLLANPDLMTS